MKDKPDLEFSSFTMLEYKIQKCNIQKFGASNEIN